MTFWFPKWRSRFHPWKGHLKPHQKGHSEEPGISFLYHVKIGNHPIETTIYKWWFGVLQGRNVYISILYYLFFSFVRVFDFLLAPKKLPNEDQLLKEKNTACSLATYQGETVKREVVAYLGLSPLPRMPVTTKIIIFLGSGIPTYLDVPGS